MSFFFCFFVVLATSTRVFYCCPIGIVFRVLYFLNSPIFDQLEDMFFVSNKAMRLWLLNNIICLLIFLWSHTYLKNQLLFFLTFIFYFIWSTLKKAFILIKPFITQEQFLNTLYIIFFYYYFKLPAETTMEFLSSNFHHKTTKEEKTELLFLHYIFTQRS